MEIGVTQEEEHHSTALDADRSLSIS